MFNREWLHDREFSSWVSGLPDDELAYCKICKKEISVYRGVGPLRAHAKGIRHNQLLKASKKGKNTSSRSSVLSKKSFNSTKPSKVHSQKASVSGLNLSFINYPSCSSAASSEVCQTVGNKHRHDPHPRERSPTPTRDSPVVMQYLNNMHREIYPRDRSPVRTTDPEVSIRHQRFVQKVEEMLSQHDVIIRGDASDFLDSYKQFLTQRVLPSTSSSSSSHLDRYSSIKSTLEDYQRQHEALRKKIKTRLVSLLSR